MGVVMTVGALVCVGGNKAELLVAVLTGDALVSALEEIVRVVPAPVVKDLRGKGQGLPIHDSVAGLALGQQVAAALLGSVDLLVAASTGLVEAAPDVLLLVAVDALGGLVGAFQLEAGSLVGEVLLVELDHVELASAMIRMAALTVFAKATVKSAKAGHLLLHLLVATHALGGRDTARGVALQAVGDALELGVGRGQLSRADEACEALGCSTPCGQQGTEQDKVEGGSAAGHG